MKIAIHNRPGSFSERWIHYCKSNGIDYLLVDSYRSDAITVIKTCDAFMWHHHHADKRDALFSKQLIYSLETAGIKCFPDFHTTWHFDDKIGQKYLLEAIDAPIVPTYVFYSKDEALEWIEQASFPLVSKLRCGAGSYNVNLIKSKNHAAKYIKKAFRQGFYPYDRKTAIVDSYRKYKENQMSFFLFLKRIAALYIKPNPNKLQQREKSYVLFQKFIPNNSFDIRICVVFGRAFALKRLVRKGDFRASGSGNIVYDKNQIDERCVKIALDVCEKLKAQSLAFDFVFEDGIPLIVEISYAFTGKAYDFCEGYWDQDLQWHQGSNFDFCGWMVEGLMSCDEKNSNPI